MSTPTQEGTAPAHPPEGGPRLGLWANRRQFALLVFVNFLVGGMIGLERTLLPLVGQEEFGLEPTLVLFSFIAAFGITKALANLAAGVLADRHTRRAVLIAGWVIGLPVPFLLGYATSWWQIVVANVLLGVNQGFAWSMAVTMKIDLAGPRRRGLALGLNEAAGYLALGLTALATGYIAAQVGLRPQPFWLGVVYVGAGLGLSVLAVRDTGGHAALEGRLHGHGDGDRRGARWVFAETSWRNRSLFGVSQAGFVNNLNDGLSWGVLPILFANAGVSLAGIGLLKATYPIVWALGQTVTGPLSDRVGRKPLIVWGMAVQAAGLVVIAARPSGAFASGLAGSVLLGTGTAMVYPALLAAVGDAAAPSWRATAVGVYRSWRDLGYAAGALVAGTVAMVADLTWAVYVTAALTLLAGVVARLTIADHHGASPRQPDGAARGTPQRPAHPSDGRTR